MTLPIQDANSFRLQCWRYHMVINIIAKVAQALKGIRETLSQSKGTPDAPMPFYYTVPLSSANQM